MIPFSLKRAVQFACVAWACAQGAVWAASDESTVRLVMVGDVMLDDGPGKVLASGRDPLAAFAPYFKAADLSIANLECVVSNQGEPEPGKPYTFRAHPGRAMSVLTKHFGAVSLANNHSGDYGPTAFADMLYRLDQKGVAYFGGGFDSEHAHRALIVERKGIKIAFLSYVDFLPRSFEALPLQPGVAWAEPEQIRFDIQEAKQRGADLVIPFMHWGWENERVSSAQQKALARQMIDAGADAVVGAHPHVVQDVEEYKGKPIVYSLGNFVFDGFDDPVNNVGWMLTLQVSKTAVQAAHITEAHINAEGVPKPSSSPAPCWKQGAGAWESKCEQKN